MATVIGLFFINHLWEIIESQKKVIEELNKNNLVLKLQGVSFETKNDLLCNQLKVSEILINNKEVAIATSNNMGLYVFMGLGFGLSVCLITYFGWGNGIMAKEICSQNLDAQTEDATIIANGVCKNVIEVLSSEQGVIQTGFEIQKNMLQTHNNALINLINHNTEIVSSSVNTLGTLLPKLNENPPAFDMANLELASDIIRSGIL